MRQISVKQAERWLDKLKNQNAQSFKEFGKILKKYQRTDDSYQCYKGIAHVLLQTPILATDLNQYLQDGNKFVINETQQDKITTLMGYIKQNRIDKFKEILTMVHDLGEKNKGLSGTVSADQQNRSLINCLKEIVKGDKQLEQFTQRALLTGQQLIKGQNLEHLDIHVNHNQQQSQQQQENQDQGSQIQPKKKIKIDKIQRVDKNTLQIQQRRQNLVRPKPLSFIPNMTQNQQKKILRHIEKTIGSAIYDGIVKLIHLYHLCVLTKNQIIDMIDFIQSEQEFQCLRDIIQSRETDRRKTGGFRPLNDNDFSTAQRASPSYVTVPSFYPIRCANRTQELKKILNDKWISVPYGSQQTFNVRNKNQFETCLLKSEDERYQFDLYTNRLKKAVSLLDKALEQKNHDSQEIMSKQLLQKIIDLNVIQIVYRNANKEQKQELQWHLKYTQYQTCTLFRDRINSQLHELKIIKEVHALKNWTEAAVKNFSKSLDLKSFEFKKGQKQKMKGSSFLTELNDRIKILQSGCQQKLFSIPFQDKKSFFSIFNSFDSSSKSERCISRKLPAVHEYDLKEYKNKSYLPIMILAFEDTQICSYIYSLIIFYLEASVSNQGQKYRSKYFLNQVLIKFFGWKSPQKRCLSSEFDEEKFSAKINNFKQMDQQQIDINRWIYTQDQLIEQQEADPLNTKVNEFYHKEGYDKQYSFGYLPPKEQNCQILYASENFYIFLRFLYALYERIIRMRQVSENKEKTILFQVLFYNCIKSREGVKFQQSLNNLFGSQAYLFSTIYKLFESLIKSINTVALCQMTNQSFKYTKSIKSQQIYLLLMNRYNLQNNTTNARMIRVNYNTQTKVIYLNAFYSYYKAQEQSKDQSRKRQEISRGIEIYSLDSVELADKKKRKHNQIYQENGIEYFFDCNTYKMATFGQQQDLLAQINKKNTFSKFLKRQLKRVVKFNSKIG